MKITYKDLAHIVPAEQRNQIDKAAALRIIHSVFCGPMTSRGMCTSNCNNCTLSLVSAFSLANANNPQALLTWRLRNELAKQQEETAAHTAIQKVDALGLPVSEGNPFDVLKQQFQAAK